MLMDGGGAARRLMDADLCVAFAVVMVAQLEGWTAEHKPMIFSSSTPMPLRQNNSICIHQSCICHRRRELPAPFPACFAQDALIHRLRSWSGISPPHTSDGIFTAPAHKSQPALLRPGRGESGRDP